jgi:LmbE family N-acetylglucosaminyl deacetylase
MFNLSPMLPRDRSLVVLFLGAHSDDIEIGCGGTVLQLASSNLDVEIHWVVFSAIDQRRKEAKASARDFLADIPKNSVELHDYPDAYFPAHYAALKDSLKALSRQVTPDIVFTHCRNDLHQDHRTISELTWNAFRDNLILEYEIPKYDGDFGQPNLFVPIPEDVCRMKTSKLQQHFASQRNKSWFTDDVFSSVMRLRGIEARSPTGYAEAFYSRKARLTW